MFEEATSTRNSVCWRADKFPTVTPSGRTSAAEFKMTYPLAIH
jgi:hypothetical protein